MMNNFSAVRAAFSGFGFIRSNPKTILSWAVVFVGLFVVFGVIMVAGAAGSMAALGASGIDLEKNPMAIMTVAPALAGLALFMMAAGLVVAGFVYGAAYRAYLRPEQKSFGYFRMGADELRLALVYLVFQVIYFAWIMGHSGVGAAAGSAGPLVQLVLFCAWVFVSIRLSLALPATFGRGRMGFGESWRLTKGRFWKMLGTYLLLVIALLLLLLLIMLFFGVIIGSLGGLGSLSNLESGVPSAAALMAMVPVGILMILAYPIAAAAFLAMVVGPSATIYRTLSAPASAADVFA